MGKPFRSGIICLLALTAFANLQACAVVSATAGAAISITGAVVSTGIKVTGAVVEAGIDAVSDDDVPE
ncbi:hypothetical protein [Limnobacter parvus]|uniref:Lipoprotein n=1 Tax=Limnobacter parvus TaxID=2939690 RepID=A0ABT1XKF9_9BURK|nr:hypothetical protein [Limnobacter parvus]MCR2747033.1 hypothetical protein [Limnobacter parvus]